MGGPNNRVAQRVRLGGRPDRLCLGKIRIAVPLEMALDRLR